MDGKYHNIDWNDRINYAMYVGTVMLEEAGYTNISYNIKNINIGWGNWGKSLEIMKLPLKGKAKDSSGRRDRPLDKPDCFVLL